MQLQLSTWQEVKTYLEHKKHIIIPIGSTEQHGPTGFIGTDALCPQAVALEVGERSGSMVAPTIAFGMAQHHLDFPGTVAMRPSTLISVIFDTVNSLARNGFQQFYFLNGHGGNIATISAAFSEIYAQTSFSTQPTTSPGIWCRQRNWWDGKGVQDLSKELFGASEGSHATCSEISLTYYLYPDHEKQARLDPKVAPNGPIYDALDFANRFPDGRMGSDPSLCSKEAGEKLFNASVEDTLAALNSALPA